MKIAVEGCCHGQLEEIYDALEGIMNEQNIVIDLLICCGDFQCPRNVQDMETMNMPEKYLSMGSFYKYYTGEKKAIVPTIFTHGNHEAVGFLKELYFGGWVAPNIYYLGYSGVINFRGLRIAGIGGIFHINDYHLGHYEMPPYFGKARVSSYHTREFEFQKIMRIEEDVDIFVSHEWPLNIDKYGDTNLLIRKKKHFAREIYRNELGSEMLSHVLSKMKPRHWFSAHLHVRFTASVLHADQRQTEFLALDKCLKSRKFLEILEIEPKFSNNLDFQYDVEWLSIIHAYHPYYNTQRKKLKVPISIPTAESRMKIENAAKSIDLTIPKNFIMSVPAFDPSRPITNQERFRIVPGPFENPQTTEFAKKFSIDLTHCCALFKTDSTLTVQNSDEIFLDYDNF